MKYRTNDQLYSAFVDILYTENLSVIYDVKVLTEMSHMSRFVPVFQQFFFSEYCENFNMKEIIMCEFHTMNKIQQLLFVYLNLNWSKLRNI